MNAIKNFLYGLAVVGVLLYVLGALVVGILWMAFIPSGWEQFWIVGWWPWIFLLAWPVAALVGLAVGLHNLGKGFREDVMK